jgi:hypothetical protein
MKYIVLILGVVIVFISYRAMTVAPIHITQHTISNGGEFVCIYESKDDFEQAQMDGIFRGKMFYTHKDGSKEYVDEEK